ncbi:MAG: nucleotidyltransferase family protein [Bacteroidales bacterium]|nr:nucleotidyltransferase family protein [Bacteroidales bacterium]
MRAVIFAAGLGTRLYPYTKDKPKALVEVNGLPMLGHTLRKIQAGGICDVVVNVHAFADKVELYLQEYSAANPEMRICVSDERDLLLETGGGLKKMQPLLEDDAFIVHNVDVLSNIDLKALQEADLNFKQHSPLHLATLAVRRTQSDRYFLFNEKGLLCGWENVKTGEQKISRPEEKILQRFGFTGIHLIHPALFPLMTEEGVFSITDVYLRLARTHEIRMFDVSASEWFDIGSPEQLELAEKKAVLVV